LAATVHQLSWAANCTIAKLWLCSRHYVPKVDVASAMV
jgi:hypothetical protein